MNNLMALAVLSVLVERPMHPYEMASVMRDRGKDRDMQIKWGSLYTVVRNMHRHGLIDAAETTRSGGRPERTVYRITAAGRDELLDWAQELISTPEPESPRFEAGLSVMGALTPQDATARLTTRLERLNQDIAAQRLSLDQTRLHVSRLFLVEAEYDLAMREAEAGWVRALLAELTAGTFPDLAHWRAFHSGGTTDVGTTDVGTTDVSTADVGTDAATTTAGR